MIFEPRLQCYVSELRYDWNTRRGVLHMPEEGDCTDMKACINLFRAIDPEVKLIETFGGGVPDTVYHRKRDRWSATHNGKFFGWTVI
ncbi:hypothetical protein [Paracoccus sp. KR1-242]|uniref:hypothetical protein n=1 Tax=Paracoccus sp. KR1-242 TaxID=3410028 RepID=UPI003C00228C